MAKIYIKGTQGKKIYVEVSDEIAQEYREKLREEWRNDSYEKYYSKSLESLGHEFEDMRSKTEELVIEKEENRERRILLKKLKDVLPCLTDLQRQTIHKLFNLNMSQSEIAREEGVAQQVVNKRVARIYAKLKKLIKNN